MRTRERIIILTLAVLILIGLSLCLAKRAGAAGDCELIANIQPEEGDTKVKYTDPEGRELCRLKIYLHDRTVIGFAPPGGEHDGYAAAFNGSHVQAHRTDPNVDLISHAQVFAVANVPPPTETEAPPTATEPPTGITPTPTDVPPTDTPPTATLTQIPPLPPTATATLPPGVTPTITPTLPPGVTPTSTPVTPTLIPPVEITPTPTDTPTVDIFYPPTQPGSPPSVRTTPAVLPMTGDEGENNELVMGALAGSFLLSLVGLFIYRIRKG